MYEHGKANNVSWFNASLSYVMERGEIGVSEIMSACSERFPRNKRKSVIAVGKREQSGIISFSEVICTIFICIGRRKVKLTIISIQLQRKTRESIKWIFEYHRHDSSKQIRWSETLNYKCCEFFISFATRVEHKIDWTQLELGSRSPLNFDPFTSSPAFEIPYIIHFNPSS